jgi:hypothetical protein
MTHSLEPSHFAAEPSSVAASWHWRLETVSGAEVEGLDRTPQHFTSQSDAESWVGETWRDLREQGVASVSLYDGDRKVYGPMSLDPPEA